MNQSVNNNGRIGRGRKYRDGPTDADFSGEFFRYRYHREELSSVDNAALHNSLRARRIALYGHGHVAAEDAQTTLHVAPPIVVAGTVSAMFTAWALGAYVVLHGGFVW